MTCHVLACAVAQLRRCRNAVTNTSPRMPGRKLTMTPAWVTGVKAAPTPVEYRDLEQPGLVLRIETSGHKTWVARYTFNGRDRRFTLGPFPAVTLKAARKAARRIIGRASNGTDPQ